MGELYQINAKTAVARVFRIQIEFVSGEFGKLCTFKLVEGDII